MKINLVAIRKALRSFGLFLTCGGFLVLWTLSAFYAEQVRAYQTPTDPIYGVHVVWIITGVTIAGMILVAANLTPGDHQ